MKAVLSLLVFVCLAVGSAASVSAETKPFKAAVAQFNPVLNERDKNIDALAAVLEDAAANGAKLIVAPEMATTGYAYENRAAIKPFVDTIPGRATEVFGRIAAKHQAYIVVGLAEVDEKTDLYYNAAALIGPQGVIGKYRKMHQWETEEHWSVWGDLGVPVFDTPLGRIGLNICFDSSYFEAARLAGLAGADILAFPTNATSAVWFLQARALENGFYVLGANRSNTELNFSMIGASAIWSPEGRLLAEAPHIASKAEDVDAPTIIYAEIDPALYDNPGKRSLKNRRPELYKDLMLKISPWDYGLKTESREIRIISLQYEPGRPGVEDKIQSLIKKSGRKADLVVLPAFSATGRPAGAGQAREMAQPLNGPQVGKFRKMAATLKAALVFSLVEQDGNRFYHTAVMLDEKGDILASYRKTHLDEREKLWATAGDEFKVVGTPWGRVALLLGGEEVWPETVGVLMVKRPDIIALPVSWHGQYGAFIGANRNIPKNKYPENAMCLWDVLASNSQAYAVVANYSGGRDGYLGGSGVYALDPIFGLDVTTLAPAAGESAVFAEIKTPARDWWYNQDKAIAMRQPHMYLPLIK